jgi:threonine/homoserine/homoserine lactone efflux protein
MPVGPVNLAVVHATLVKGKLSGYRLAFGALIVEVAYCAISLFGLHILSEQKALVESMQWISIPVLLTLGLMSLFKKDFLKRDYTPKKSGNEWLTGMTLTLSNPMLLFYWITVTTLVKSHQWMEDHVLDNIVFLFGVISGLSLLFFALIRLSALRNNKITPRFKRNMNLWVGWIFIGLACIMTLRAFGVF